MVTNLLHTSYLPIAECFPDWVDEHCTGILLEASLSAATLVCRQHLELLPLFVQIVEYAKENAISDCVFDQLMHFPECARDEFVVQLSHKHLPENQLIALCKTGIAFECFYELALLYYTDAQYSVMHLKTFLAVFSSGKYGDQYPYLLAELAGYTPSNMEKGELISTLLESLS